MATPQFIHLPFEGHLDCFQALEIMNKFRWGSCAGISLNLVKFTTSNS